MKKEIKSIDILVAVAKSGGVENIMNMMTEYFFARNINVRVIQVIYEGDEWLNKKECFNYLFIGKNGHTLQEFSSGYSDFIRKNGASDIILAEAWPYMCYVAKTALIANGVENTTILSHLHAPLSEYRRAGYGDASHLELADGHLIISKMIRNELEGVVTGKLIDVYNPVDFSKIDNYLKSENNKKSFKNNSSTSLPRKKRKLYYVGRISQEKRIETIIEALSKENDYWELHVVGDGNIDYVNSVKYLAKTRGLVDDESVIFHGWHSEPWKLAKEADYLVLASAYEGFPLTAVEALHIGIPVISTPVSGITELIEPGVTGYLFPTDDYEMLSKILRYISSGLFLEIDSTVCKEKVIKHEKSYALTHLYNKMQEFID